ncbi:hypothetical protein TRICI_004571 [Trichomonascus ciferrii]|uniref:Uncharacterized protein n=1 Tax=Trichomonascus ciferrii TaxID=44093 RepID=A0A642V0M4_9ASCO|nr:hypothetical protein TRICI_004571 [Trichomonascus ciferrii]
MATKMFTFLTSVLTWQFPSRGHKFSAPIINSHGRETLLCSVNLRAKPRQILPMEFDTSCPQINTTTTTGCGAIYVTLNFEYFPRQQKFVSSETMGSAKLREANLGIGACSKETEPL